MIVKIMKKNTGNDQHPRASYHLYDNVAHVQFREPGEVDNYPSVEIAVPTPGSDGYEFSYNHIPVCGTVYVMTDDGQTVDKFEVSPDSYCPGGLNSTIHNPVYAQ